ncbi:MAG: diaminopropionate ammonia-lyase [Coriobacteriales bacterium]|nr:diaminopropionate ammonia-lyase [Coriobacteriales bacterium]
MEFRFSDFTVLANETAPGMPQGQQAMFNDDVAKNVVRFHQSVPGYEPTELISWQDYAKENHIAGLFIKNESTRFGLKAFKGLGGSYAMFRILCQEFGFDPLTADYRDFRTPEIQNRCKDIHFITATDGNHGKGVSWAAKLFGCPATVFMPAGTVEARRKAIEDAGNATAEITPWNYDRTVAYAAEVAAKNNWILIQDTAWDGYELYPEWVIDGYMTLALEMATQLGDMHPTHVFLQAGVGSMAGGIMEYLYHHYSSKPPLFTIVEPTETACIYDSALAGDGRMYTTKGHASTIMAGLNCGTPCKTVWPVLRDMASYYCACKDDVTKLGMITYAHPLGRDRAITAGESGAVTGGLVFEILKDEKCRQLFRIDEKSVILLINTEGDTDPENYRSIVHQKQPVHEV